MMVMRIIILIILCPGFLLAQPNLEGQGMSRWFTTGNSLPEKILSARSVVLYSSNLSAKEINDVHEGLARTGIDAVAYFESDKIFAGTDADLAFSQYFISREIGCFVIVDKKQSAFHLMVTTFNGKASIIDVGQAAWFVEDKSLKEALRVLNSTALNTYKRQNMLIGDVPETDLVVPIITGRRTEAFASDLKVDKLAVQKFGDAALDAELEEIMKSYPFKYGLVDNSVSELDLRKQGYFYILRNMHTRGSAAKQLLGYDVSRAETAIVSITYPNGGEQIKTYSSDTPVYKFYVRQIEFNNVFLGTKWDADITWQQALRNFTYGFRKEMRVN